MGEFMKKQDFFLRERYKYFFLLYFLFIVGIAFLRFPDIRNELKYFAITDQMLLDNNFLVLKYFNVLYPDKPPVYFWLLSFLRNTFQNNFYPLALIVGGVIPGAVTAYLYFKILIKISTEKVACIVTTLLVTLPYLVGVSLVLRMDYLMTMFITIALYIFFEAYYSKEKISTLKVVVFYLAIALGVLVKGGAAFAIPLITILIFLFLDKNLKYLKSMKPFLGLFIILIVLGSWFLSLMSSPEGKEYIGLLLGQETIGRMVKAKTHTKPIYYYLKLLPLTTLPIAPFFIGGLYLLLKKIKNFKKWKPIDKISFCWFIPSLIFFSLLSGKLDIYLLPLYPAIITIGYRFIEVVWSGTKDKIYKIIIGINLSIIAVLAISLPYYNENYSIETVVAYLQDSTDRVYSYKFIDAKNISHEIGRENIEDISENELNMLLDGDIVITRNKYTNNIKKEKFEEIYSNKVYTIFIKNCTKE